MWVEQVEDAMVTGDASPDEEYAHPTDEGVHVTGSRPAVPEQPIRIHSSPLALATNP